jgi:peptide/nickel transport system permease protein
LKTARFVLGRLLALAVTLLISSFAIYGALFIAPGSPIAFLTRGRTASPADIAVIQAQYHLDKPLPVQYWLWLTRVVRGDFGKSIIYRQDVTSLLADRAVNTIWLVAFASVIILVVGIPLGILAGLSRGVWDSGILTVTSAAMAVPAFVAVVGLVSLFAVQLGWFPVFGSGQGVLDRLDHLVLPALALALSFGAYVARLTRSSVRAEMSSEHVQTAQSRAIPRRQLIRRHILRNAAIPIVTVIGLTVGGLMAGAVVVEQSFQLNGLGSYLVQAVGEKDFPVVQAIVLIFVTVFVVINTMVDLAYARLDPRIVLGKAS